MHLGESAGAAQEVRARPEIHALLRLAETAQHAVTVAVHADLEPGILAAPEVGLLPVFMTDTATVDPLFAGLPRELVTLQWHGDTFSLPEGAVLLASSPAYPNQAFRWGRCAYAIQFHLEVSREMAEEWARVPAYADALAEVLGPGAATALVDQLAARSEEMLMHGRALFGRWLDLVPTAGSRRIVEV